MMSRTAGISHVTDGGLPASPLLRAYGGCRALASGIAAGLIAMLLQQALLASPILAVEVVEKASLRTDQGRGVEAGFERMAYTLLFNCLACVGIGVLLSVAKCCVAGPPGDRAFWGVWVDS